MVWITIGIASLVGVLVLLKLWAWGTVKVAAHQANRPPKKRAMSFSTYESDVDDQFEREVALWKVLKLDPLFWLGCLCSAGLVIWAIKFGLNWSQGNPEIALVLILLLVVADLALPVIAITSDTGNNARWWEFDTRDRSPWSWGLLILFTGLSCIIVIGSTSEVSTSTQASKDIGKLGYEQRVAQLSALQKEHDAIPAESQAPEALEKIAKDFSDKAEREGERGGCSTKCEGWKDKAREYAAQAANAKRKDSLRKQITAARADLEGNSGSARTETNGLGRFIERASGGAISKADVAQDILTIMGLAIVVGTTVLWVVIAERAHGARHRLVLRAGAIADAARQTAGLPPKYIIQAPTLALPAPEHATGDTIIINGAAEDMRRRYANDPALLEVDGLFGDLLVPDEASMCVLATLYRAYQVSILRTNPDARYMSEVTMAQKLVVISQHRDDVAFSADGRIKGWRLRAADETAKAAAIAAE